MEPPTSSENGQDARLLSGGSSRSSHLSTDPSLVSTVRIGTSFDGYHEDGSSFSYTRDNHSSRFTFPRKPVAITATSAEALFLASSSRQSQQATSKRGSNWYWEISGLFLSFGSTTALVAVLLYVDGLPLTQWSGIISLNALISTLGAISRASLGFAISSCLAQAKWNWFKKRPDSLVTFDRFDDASRGPWGSLWLVIWLRAGHWVVVGAIVTIILIGFEPFLQAVITLSGQMDPDTGFSKAQLGRSEVLDVGLYSTQGGLSPIFSIPLPDNSSVGFEAWKFSPDLGMVSSFNGGFYNSSSSIMQTASFICPTANCTWPLFTSLAVCSECSDVTSRLQRFTQFGDNLGTISSHVAVQTDNYMTYSLPRLNLTNVLGGSAKSAFGGEVFISSAYMAATITADPQLTLSFKNISTIIAAAQIIKAASGYETGGLEWDNTPVSATECVLYFCVNAYESVVENGKFRENIIASWGKRNFSSYRATDSFNSFSQYEKYDKWNNYSLYPGPGEFNRSDLELFIPQEDVERYALPENSTLRFEITQRTVGSTMRFVHEQFLSSDMAWPPSADQSDQKPVVGALYKSTDLSATFENVAWSVSNWIRDISSVKQDGDGKKWVIHIHVEWPYMVLPLLTIVLGLLFSLLSIIETRRLGLDPWKTDMIATLTHSVDAETRAQLRHADRNGYLEASVKAMDVKFENVGCGLELRTQQT